MRKIGFISGPISNAEAIIVAENIHRFEVVENLLLKSGYATINPAADWGTCKLGGITYEMLMEKDRALIKVSDFMFALPGSHDSNGAYREGVWAMEFGVPIFKSLDEVHQFFEDDWIAELVPNA